MVKYKSTDARTGYKVGAVVELKMEALNALPLNVYMLSLEEKKGVNLEAIKAEAARADLKANLLDKGLSPGRTEKVLEKYPSLSELKASASDVAIDPLTDELIKKNFSKKKKVKKVD